MWRSADSDLQITLVSQTDILSSTVQTRFLFDQVVADIVFLDALLGLGVWCGFKTVQNII